MFYLPQLRETKPLLPYHCQKFSPQISEPGGRTDAIRQTNVVDRPVKERASDCQPQVLLIGDDPTLQFSRRKILESAGYTVRSVKSDLVVEELFLNGIELVLLCHSIVQERMTEIVRAFTRLAPKIPVLLISSMDGGTPASIPTRPAAFLDAVAATLAHH